MRILLSGGGTAGHINPAIAIARYARMQDDNTEVLFVGTKKGLESTLVPKEGFDISYVNVAGLKKELSLESLVSATKLGAAIVKSIALIKKFKPDVVVGTGGYVCVSSVLAAKLLKIPTLVHEQNVFPGSAVGFLSDKCSVTAISFEESRKYLKNANRITLTGNPIRPSVLTVSKEQARKKLGIGDQKMILAFGGSLGAMHLNDVMVDFIKKNGDFGGNIIYFATGKRDFKRVREALGKLPSNIILKEYIDDMDVVMNASDVVVCRSGAITLAEVCALGKPAVLVPSPNVTNNHQEYNARALSDRGAAITITEDSFNSVSLRVALSRIINDEAYYDNMSASSLDMGISDACEKIYKILLEIAG